ncbi:MAG TPA: hypothetical protein VN948_02625 [Terriglobales bacterium]|nr:hypothetical protein [Terriglobales bacterium]
MANAAAERHVVMPVTCTHCKTEQVVQVRARTRFAQIDYQTIRCANTACNRPFDVMVPDVIVGGPFMSSGR